jgi:hypothetical protein
MARFILIWDLDDDPEGNVQHVAEHEITQEEVRRFSTTRDHRSV